MDLFMSHLNNVNAFKLSDGGSLRYVYWICFVPSF